MTDRSKSTMSINYVFTFRMAPMRVRLRLMKHPKARFMYLAIEPRD